VAALPASNQAPHASVSAVDCGLSIIDLSAEWQMMLQISATRLHSH